MKRNDRTAVYFVVLGALLLALAYVALSRFYRSDTDYGNFPSQPPPSGSFHRHADFAVFVNGAQVNFSSPEFDAVDPRIHIHLSNFAGGSVLHIERETGTLGVFFASVGMRLNSTCFSLGADYCSNATHALKFFVNGNETNAPADYVPQDLDRLLLSYGNESSLTFQTSSVTNYACIFSGTCVPPPGAENRIFYN